MINLHLALDLAIRRGKLSIYNRALRRWWWQFVREFTS